jgi:hypothetical protein
MNTLSQPEIFKESILKDIYFCKSGVKEKGNLMSDERTDISVHQNLIMYLYAFYNLNVLE